MKQLDDSTLVAYVDGELDAEREREVEAAMAFNPEAQSRVQVFRQTSELLRATFGDSGRKSMPSALIKAAQGSKHKTSRSRRWRVALPLAASLAAFAVSLGGGYMAGLYHVQQQLEVTELEHWLDEAAKYYRLYAQNDHYLVEMTAAEIHDKEADLGDWLNRKLRVPDLSRHGLTFRGARFVALEGDLSIRGDAQPAVLLVYDLPGGRPLGVCITAFSPGGEQTQTLGRRANMSVLYWTQSGFGHVLMGWAEPNFLRAVATDVADQLGSI
jgi:anti-sigma factor RsiW